MKIVIDISKDRYDGIMSMDWNNCRRFFDEEIRAIHDGKVLEQEPCENVPDLYECPCGYGWDKNKVVRHHFCPNCGRAVDGSIKTEQEPCDDCISRSAVLDINEHHHGQMPNHVNHEIWKEIKALPSVTPQPKMGRWIMSDDGLYRPICNNCGAHPWKGYIPTVEEATEVFKYCSNCGYAMQEVKDE